MSFWRFLYSTYFGFKLTFLKFLLKINPIKFFLDVFVLFKLKYNFSLCHDFRHFFCFDYGHFAEIRFKNKSSTIFKVYFKSTCQGLLLVQTMIISYNTSHAVLHIVRLLKRMFVAMYERCDS